MADKKKTPPVPDAVAAMMAEANAQRGLTAPTPLPIEDAQPDDDGVVLSAPEMLEECAREPETDIGNARRLLIRYGQDIMHVTHIGWHGYDGRRWVEDASGAVVRKFAHITAEFIDDEAIRLDCPPQEQAAIEAGRKALDEMRKMGKPPATSSEIDQVRMDELDRLIEDMELAVADKIRLGSPKTDWGR
jgi:putative DNA primase/helicase